MKLEHNIFLAFSLAVFFLITAKCDHQTPPSDYSDTTDGSDTSSRRPQDIPVELNCYIPFCDITGPLPKTSNVYNINLGSNSIIILEFPIGGSRLDIGLSLISNPAANIRTDIALFSDGNELDSLASSVTDPSWEKYYTINQSRFRDRRLAVQIRSNSQAEGSYVQFKIQQRPSSDDDGPEIWVIGVSLAAAVFVFIVLTTCCCYAYTRRRRQRRPRTSLPVTDRQDPPAERAPVMMKQSKNKDQLSAENLDQRFPEAPFSSFYSFFEQKTCSICLEELKYDQNCRQLYCEHIFHAECIKLWILNQLKKGNACCPNCNKDVSKTKEMKKTFFKHAKRTKIEV